MAGNTSGKTAVGTWIGFALIMLWCLFPVAWIISLSFKSEGETGAGSPQRGGETFD